MIIGAISIGIICMIIEFAVPGIGFFALISLISFLIALYLLLGATTTAAITVSILLLAGVIGFFAILRRMPNSALGRKIANVTQFTKAGGYISSEEKESLIGAIGTAHTVLRPAGIALIHENYVDVVTEGMFLEQGTPLQVISVEGGRVVVRKIKE